MRGLKALLLLVLCGFAITTPSLVQADAPSANANDRLRIVGSATVYPMVTLVAEKFGQNKQATPIVEALGTGSGFKLFCAPAAAGTIHPAFAMASRPIKDSERQLCAGNGFTDLVELPIGMDGIVLAGGKKTPALELTTAQLFLALAAKHASVPKCGAGTKCLGGQTTLVDNPYQNWSDIDAKLPKLPIVLYGPPPSAGTRDALIELLTAKGCDSFDSYKSLAETEHKAACSQWRQDGKFIEVGENYDLLLQKLKTQPGSYGLFGYSYFDQQRDQFTAAKLDGVAPDAASVANGPYPLARRLYVYADAKALRQSPSAQAFAKALLAEEAVGADGYLTSAGLIPLPTNERNATRLKLPK
jgi:phosphate transport system substrate-binding protein